MPATARNSRGSPRTPPLDHEHDRPRSQAFKRALFAGLLGALFTGGALVAANPIIRSFARARGNALGLDVTVADARFGWGKLKLKGVTVTSPDLPGVAVSLSEVDVAPSLGGVPRRIDVHGGSVRVNGPFETLDRELKTWRDAHLHSRTVNSSSVTPVSLDGVDVVWTDPGTATPDLLWGVRYDRRADGRESIGADLARVTVATARVEVSRGLAKFERDGSRRDLQAFSVANLHATIDLDTDAPVATAAARKGLPAKASSPPPAVFDDRAASDRGARLRADFAKAAEAGAAWLKRSTKVEVTGVHLDVRHAGEALNFGPATIVVAREQDRVRFAVTSGADDGAAPIRFDVDVPLGAGAVEIGLAGGPVSLRALGVEEHDMGLEDVERAAMEVNGRATLAADGRSLRVSGRSRFDALSLYESKLANEPVRGLALAIAGQTDVSLDGSRVHIDDLEVDVGKVKVHATGDLTREGEHAAGRLHVEIPLAACSDMLASIPPSLVPLLSGMDVTGTFAFSGDLAFDARRPGDTRVDWNVANECHITKVPPAIATDRFAHPWERTVLGVGDVPTTIESGPGTPNWVPLLDVSPFMATAVVVCEDANFWVHGGFNDKSIRDSIRDNLRAGKFLRGASTVSMQLAKNLYLAREKTVSRKLQEAILTLLLEQTLTKEQILELYLNVIEFAPSVYGIGPAAEYYFRSLPRDLSLGQAFYLASILPNPKAHHFAMDGTLTPRWTAYLRHLMEIAHKIHKIDDHDLAAGLAESVRFGVPSVSDGSPDAATDGAAPDVTELAPADAESPDEGP